ncbi:GIY-YIG nuclease family protein [Flavobacterium sedimenticola]|uniref:GIY-YIG nuclease family protein n=1 Tax=Flavobacterium sedimenticola TaxID=3043286 RepID=A0ABT6XT88_9FLAO|nr:GIY-YIG nuclease family protein [Flavobacterium sedimenticola]MDI9258195.1 GIY-YIG nuclease family protein [Flavobacterium sedimenticola]
MKLSYVYILECADGTYYTGVTSNLTKRLFRHETGFYPTCYTVTRRPVSLVFYAEFTNICIAIEKEKQIKKWSKAKKKALINGDFDALPNLAKKDFGK